MAKIPEDYIGWVLTLDASAAEQELHKVNKETRDLKERQKELNDQLKRQRKDGRSTKKSIEETRTALSQVSAAIQVNVEKTKLLERQMGLANLSMSQLRRRASDLKKQLDRTSKSLHPKEWELLNNQLRETRQRMADLNAESGNIRTEDIMMSAAMANIFSSAVVNMTRKLKEFTAEGVAMAESADGVQRAFNKLDRPDLLDNLRSATKGTVNDLLLMQAAVKARDFRIPLEDLGKYLAYAQLKAQETGQSVDYLTDSIIMGLGRQSKQILDNLGLSAAEISEEVAKAGDFVDGVTAIVDRQLAAAGDAYVSAADKAAKATVALENAQLKLGQTMLPLKELWDSWAAKGASALSFLVKYRQLTFPVITALLGLALAKAKLNATTSIGIALLKAQNALLVTTKVVVLAAKAAYNLLTGNIIRCQAAMRMLTAAIASNPLGLLATALAAVVSGIMAFAKSANKASDAISVMDSVSRRMAESEDTTVQRVKNLTRILHDNTLSIDQRRAALEEIMKTVPDYHAQLTAEGEIINENTDAIKVYLEKLEQMARLQAAQEYLTELYKQQLELEQKVNEARVPLENGSLRIRDVRRLVIANRELLQVNKDIEALSTSIFNIEQAAKSSGSTVPKSLIKELEDQRRLLVEARDAATTEQDIAARNREIQLIDAKIKRLQELGKTVDETAADEQNVSQKLTQTRKRLLEQEKQAADSRADLLKKSLDEGLMNQAEYDVSVAASATRSAQERLEIEQQLQESLKNMSFIPSAEREKTEADVAQRILEAETAVNKARMDEEQVFRNNLKAIRESGVLDTEQTLDQQRTQELAALDTYYKAALQQAGDDAQKQLSVKEAYLEASWRITRKYSEKEQALEEADIRERQQLREQLGLVSWKSSLDARQLLLEEALKKQAITEEEYSRKSTQIWMEAWHEQISYYQDLAAGAFESLMQSELDLSAARYDVLISQARKAGQDTTALEEEKEARQLEIQKKYADVNFAIKASQIIADTAVAIMQAYGQLGPVAGTVAAVLMGVVGAVQLASANAERERVKQLQPGSAAGTNTRVLPGREAGGYISVRRRQDGKLFRDVPVDADHRGYIDRPMVIVGEGPRSKEFVASNAAVENPTVAPLLNIIDKAQLAGNIRTLDMTREIQAYMIGRERGGRIDDNRRQPRRSESQQSAVPLYGKDTLERLDDTLRMLQRDGIAASVALTEIDRKRELRDRARKIGSKR